MRCLEKRGSRVDATRKQHYHQTIEEGSICTDATDDVQAEQTLAVSPCDLPNLDC